MNFKKHVNVVWWILAGLASSSRGHDMWIQPSTFTPAVGELVHVDLKIGHEDDAEVLPRNSDRIMDFFSHGPTGRREIIGREGLPPAGYLRPETPGIHQIAYRSHDALSTLEPAKFEGYLKEEGLDSILEERAKRNEKDKPGVEAYSRSLKSIVRVGDAPAADYDRKVGLPLELVPSVNPFTAEAKIRFQLFYEDQPLAGAYVTAQRLRGHAPPSSTKDKSKEASNSTLSSRTDEQGFVEFTLKESGAWMLACVHMVRAPAEEKADWKSVWTALTLERP